MGKTPKGEPGRDLFGMYQLYPNPAPWLDKGQGQVTDREENQCATRTACHPTGMMELRTTGQTNKK